MYFKKQMFFSLFMLVILLFIFYKQSNVKNRFETSVLTEVQIVDKRCDRGLGKNDRSYFEFEYNDKIYEQRLSRHDCKDLMISQNYSLYYDRKRDSFLLPEITKENYYKKFLIIIGILLALGLIPYKLIFDRVN